MKLVPQMQPHEILEDISCPTSFAKKSCPLASSFAKLSVTPSITRRQGPLGQPQIFSNLSCHRDIIPRALFCKSVEPFGFMN